MATQVCLPVATPTPSVRWILTAIQLLAWIRLQAVFIARHGAAVRRTTTSPDMAAIRPTKHRTILSMANLITRHSAPSARRIPMAIPSPSIAAPLIIQCTGQLLSTITDLIRRRRRMVAKVSQSRWAETRCRTHRIIPLRSQPTTQCRCRRTGRPRSIPISIGSRSPGRESSMIATTTRFTATPM